ncbi:hypothetical protein [Streptomyces albipurpureus]|uniref:Uncharacterized protein n=1 Tax=Streptomyces albipurpureus TaxID=2897419 RepID=A0ABT0UUF2_9ACTN|nr:hypothetical protein [Streptomyces sp. CWNU-1]MCM2391730.1 hypothetical protein [Streptomyces sp. CWNU-1]
MTLDELIVLLESVDPGKVVRRGFNNPHSYRGYYDELAFEPAWDTTVAEMLEAVRSAKGATYEGWKGGEFTMSGYTECWLSIEGSASGETLGRTLVELMLGLE